MRNDLKKEVNFLPEMKRPYKVPGIGWILAVVALLVALLHLVGFSVPVLYNFDLLIILIALAILL
jgi:hypothetical protein